MTDSRSVLLSTLSPINDWLDALRSDALTDDEARYKRVEFRVREAPPCPCADCESFRAGVR